MLNNWLQYSERTPNPYSTFKLIDCSEKQTPDSDIRSFLGLEFLKAYRDLGYLKFDYEHEPEQKLIDYIKKNTLPSSSNQFSKNVRQGDFGETLASLIVSYFHGLTVPIQKLQWKFNNEKSVFCTDMIAHNSENVITDLYYYEIKSRLDIRKEPVNKVYNHVTINAHNSLKKDEQAPNEGIADFLSRYYYNRGDYSNTKKYSDIVKNPSKYKRNYELFFIIEKSKYKDNILDALNNLPPSLSPLKVTIVLIDNFNTLVLEAEKEVINNAIKHVYNK